MAGVGEFIIGYVAGVMTLVALSAAIGFYMYRHPKVMVRTMMGRKHRGNSVDQRETTSDRTGG